MARGPARMPLQWRFNWMAIKAVTAACHRWWHVVVGGLFISSSLKIPNVKHVNAQETSLPSQLLQCQAASSTVSCVGPEGSFAFICHGMYTILHFEKGQMRLTQTNNQPANHSAALCVKLLSPELLFLLKMGSPWVLKSQTGMHGLFHQRLPWIKEVFLSI